jgi:hypothetical protein
MKKLRVMDRIKFSVIDQIDRLQVKTIEEVEIADRIDGKTLFNLPDANDPVEMTGFSIWHT